MTSLGPRPPAAEGDAETCTGLSQPRRRLSRTSHALGEGRLPGGEESSTPEPRANPPPQIIGCRKAWRSPPRGDGTFSRTVGAGCYSRRTDLRSFPALWPHLPPSSRKPLLRLCV